LWILNSENQRYLPLVDGSNEIPGIDPMDTILDRNFRLYREELINQLIENVDNSGLTLNNLLFLKAGSNQRIKDQFIYLFKFEHSHVRWNDPRVWEKKFQLGSIVVLTFCGCIKILAEVTDKDINKLVSKAPEIGITPISPH